MLKVMILHIYICIQQVVKSKPKEEKVVYSYGLRTDHKIAQTSKFSFLFNEPQTNVDFARHTIKAKITRKSSNILRIIHPTNSAGQSSSTALAHPPLSPSLHPTPSLYLLTAAFHFLRLFHRVLGVD